MATDKLINSTQGDDIIGALNDIADNVGNITYGPQTSADKVVSMLGYAEAAEAASINPGDTLNVAIGKLEKKANDNATDVANKIDKLTNATAGDIATVTATGEIADSTVSIADSNTGLADSDAAVPTSKTVKTYVDSTATGISRYLGTITAANQLSTSAKKGDFYVVKTAWTGVHAGDEIIAEKDGPAQTIDGTNWSLLHNEADTDTKYQFGEGTSNGTFLVTPSDTGVAQSVPIKGLGSAAYTTADTSSLTNDNNHVPTSALAKSLLDAKVPTTRKVNNKALSSDITLSASDVSAVPSSNVTTTLPASSAAASTSKVMSEKLVYDNYVQNSDFVVAQQNINYAINTGVKNTFNLLEWCDPGIYSTVNGLNARVMEDGRIHIYGTMTSQNSTDLSVKGSYTGTSVVYTTPSTDSYTLSAKTEGNVYEAQLHFYSKLVGPYDDGIYLVSGTDKKELHTTDYTWLMVRVPAVTGAIDFYITPMVSLTGIGNTDFVPYGASNSDLTYLEAEDRAALIDVVDTGAKNVFDLNTDRNSNSNPQATNGLTATLLSDGTITVTGTPTTTDKITFSWSTHSAAYLRKYNGYYLSGSVVPSGTVTRTEAAFELATSPYSTYVSSTNGSLSGSALNLPESSNQVLFFIRLYCNSTSTPINVTFKPMLCTKAAFGVSSKFVPYRPNYDLVVSEIGHHMVDDGNTNHSTATCNCSNWTAGVYLVAVNRYQNQTTAYGTALYLMTVNDNILPLFTTIVETADCKATFALSNDKVLSITYPHSAFWQAYAKRI